jgi:hypothetical protein
MCWNPASIASPIAFRVMSASSYETCRWIERVIAAGSRPISAQ